MAIGAMEDMAEDFSSKGDLESAAGCFDEVARLIEAHAENAPDDATAAEHRRKAQDYRERAKRLRTGQVSGGAAVAGVGGAWEVTWTQAGGQGQPAPAPGPGWEPFGITFSPSDPTAPVVGWRRSS